MTRNEYMSRKFVGGTNYEIRLGTSGYSFRDWVGPFYPEGTRPGEMLEYYSGRFGTVEINSTYYGILSPAASRSMVERTPDDFRFILKLHSSMTHGRDATEDQWKEYSAMLEPFTESGKLSCLLAQFPYSFGSSDASVDYVLSLGDRIGRIPLAVEMRHDSWYSCGHLDRLSEAGMAPVSVDLPRLPHLPPPVPVGGKPFGYVRLHGRNTEQWWNGGPLRYDYTYSDAQLRSWLPVIDRLGRESGLVYVMFNNCHFGQAVRDAIRMEELFRGE